MAAVFACLSCHVAFKDPNIQRQHYKTDWHRFNLKRKVAEYSPVTAEEFERLVLEQRSIQAENERDKTMHCDVCRKTFSGEHTYNSHVASRKHRDNVQNAENGVVPKIPRKPQQLPQQSKKEEIVEVVDDEDMDIETDSEVEELSDEEWNEDDENNPINKNNCLFCNHHSRNLKNNLKHMTEAHSFFVPDKEYCYNLKGFLLYLGAKIFEGNICLWCKDTGRSFKSYQATQKHMLDKGHCKVLFEEETMEEFMDYYDYSSSYPDAVDHEGDEEVEVAPLDGTGFELTLPTGDTIGHRSLMRYYKQSLDPKKRGTLALRSKINSVVAGYKSMQLTPLQKEIVKRKSRGLKSMHRWHQKFYSQVGVKANKLQKHFRPQVDF